MSKRLLIFLLIILLGLIVSFVWWKNATSSINPSDNTPVTFIIPKGQTIKEIASNLKKEGLIKDKIAFFSYARFSGLATKFQAGNFRLNRSMNVFEIAQQLTKGTTDVWVTLIEGMRNEEIAEILNRNLAISERQFMQFAQEGYMFPDTYLIPKETTAGQVSEIILNNFRKKITSEIIEKGKVQGLNLDELITLASIIEREAKNDNDRQIIAGILLKRITNDWRLQTDATIQYALGYQIQEKSWWKKNLTTEDLEIDSPYNTYIYVGLPPGPICNPGLSAINAVISPKNSSYWYYLSDKQGNIHYATSIEEHKLNIETYLD